MSTPEEDAIQAILDTNPNDWQTRCILGEYLTDIGDPRGEGYRALGILKREWNMFYGYESTRGGYKLTDDKCVLPMDWRSLIISWNYDKSTWNRRSREDAAALAFSKLPVERQNEILSLELEERSIRGFANSLPK